MNYFFDTSALVKLYHAETGSDCLEAELSKYAEDLVVSVSDISRIEFYSVVLKKVRTKEIKLEKARQALDLFEQDWNEFNCITVDATVKANALDLLQKFAPTSNLGTLDALQLSTALLAHRTLPIDCFVTSDKRLLSFAGMYFNTFSRAAKRLRRNITVSVRRLSHV